MIFQKNFAQWEWKTIKTLIIPRIRYGFIEDIKISKYGCWICVLNYFFFAILCISLIYENWDYFFMWNWYTVFLYKVNYWILLKSLRIFMSNLNKVISSSFTFLSKIHLIYTITSTLSLYPVNVNWNLQVLWILGIFCHITPIIKNLSKSINIFSK